jgi:glycosyltransferase involved in cell wall biosynthesis
MDNNVLFIGPYEKRPKGGVAFVLSEYEKLLPKAYFLSTSVSYNKLIKVFVLFKALLRFIFLLIFHSNIKIIHIHVSSYRSFNRKYIFFRLAELFNKKIVCHIHGGSFHLFYEGSSLKVKNRIHYFIENADCIICLSKKWEKYFLKQFNLKKILVVPNIISEPKLNSLLYRNNERVTFLFLGLIDYNKGIWLLLETIKQFREHLLGKAVFKIGGNGKTDELKRLIKEYKLEDLVTFQGWVSGNLKQKLLNESDIYILPSYNEGLPISILEAMSYGLPILATNVGGIPEIVDLNNGIIIEPGNMEQLRDAIILGIQNRQEFENKGEVSSKRVSKHLPQNVKKDLHDLYKTILE